MAFESTFKAIDNTLHHDDGCSTALDYVEQSSWVLFLKYFDDLELTREQAAELKFQTAENRHEMTQIYEDRLRQMGNAGFARTCGQRMRKKISFLDQQIWT